MLKSRIFGLAGNSFWFSFIFLLFFVSCKKKSKQEQLTDYYQLPTISKNGHYRAVIEIPAGKNHKIEYEKFSRKFLNDSLEGEERIIGFLPYPGNYGFIPSTYSDPKKGGDGDALDVLILAESQPTETIVEFIPIAMIELVDEGESDNKIIGIPADEKLQIIKAKNFEEFSANYPAVRKIIGEWFKNYDPEAKVTVKKWVGEAAAKAEIEKWRVN